MPRAPLTPIRWGLAMAGAVMALHAPGCSSTYEHHSVQASLPELKADGRIYISFPEPANAKDQGIPNSSQVIVEALRIAFSKFSKNIFLSRGQRMLETNLESAKKWQCQYLIIPSILKWEDHATEWSGVRDRIEIRLTVSEVATGQVLNETTINGKGRWLTDGGDRPEDLLAEPFARYAASLFRAAYTPSGMPQ